MCLFALMFASRLAWSADPEASSPTASEAQPAPSVANYYSDYYSMLAARLAAPTTGSARMDLLREELLAAPGDAERGVLHAAVEVLAALDRGAPLPEDVRQGVILTALRNGPAAGMGALNEARAANGESPLAVSTSGREGAAAPLSGEPLLVDTQVCAVRPGGDALRMARSVGGVDWGEVWDGNTQMTELRPGERDCWDVEPGRAVYYSMSARDRQELKDHPMRGYKCWAEPFEAEVPKGFTLTIEVSTRGVCPTMEQVGLSR